MALTVLLQALQILTVLVCAPLLRGIINRGKAIVQSKRGPSLWQPYRDLWKLFQKGSVVSEHATWIYRVTPYRLDYYNYHRWSAPPGTMLSNYLQDAFSRSGRFRAVLHEPTDSVPVTLGGRVIAIEEVDTSKTSWVGRIAVELTLTDTLTNKVLWSQRFDETEPLSEQTPEGLARALSRAMARITRRALPAVADIAVTAERAAVQGPRAAVQP